MMCQRCERLEEEVAWLKSELGVREAMDAYAPIYAALRAEPRMDGVSGRVGVAKLLATLYAAGRSVSAAQIMDAVPPKDGHEDERDIKLAAILVCHARKFLGRDGINTVWGVGYSLTHKGREQIGAILNQGRENQGVSFKAPKKAEAA